MKKLSLRKKDGSIVEAELIELDLNYIDKIMELQNIMYYGLANKDFYSCTAKEDFEKTIEGEGKIIGCISIEERELIAMGVYIQYGYEEHNYGYDIKIQGEELLKVGQLESTIVKEEYRGNKLQIKMCEVLEEIAINCGMNLVCATVAPENIYSLNTFNKLGYKIMIEKLKYEGLNRYVLAKKLQSF